MLLLTASPTGATASPLDGIERVFKRSPAAPAFPVREAGYLVNEFNLQVPQVGWLDDRRVIFAGADPADLIPRRGDGVLQAREGVFIWDIETNEVTRHSDIRGYFCHADGYLRYLYRADERVTVFREGPFGREKEVEIPRSRAKDWALNPFTCREYRPADYRPTPDAHVVPLREGHGFLHLGPMDKLQIAREHREEEAVQFYPPGNRQPIALPMDIREASHLLISYSSHRNSYLLYSPIPKSRRIGGIVPWPKGEPQSLYILEPSGRATSVNVPYHAVRAGISGDYWMTRTGVLMTADSVGRGLEGLYLIRDGKFTQVLRGTIVALAVSPDGCNVAISVKATAPDERKRSPGPRLKVVDVCKREGSRR